MFQVLDTQWTYAMGGGQVGLSCSSIESVLRLMGIPAECWAERFAELRVMEDEALRADRGATGMTAATGDIKFPAGLDGDSQVVVADQAGGSPGRDAGRGAKRAAVAGLGLAVVVAPRLMGWRAARSRLPTRSRRCKTLRLSTSSAAVAAAGRTDKLGMAQRAGLG